MLVMYFFYSFIGVINEKRLRELMTTMGDRWSNEKVDELFHGAPIQDGNFDYKEFTRMIMHGQEEEEGQTNQT
ncbi:putative myosin regulatory light chain 2 smooth muscle [Schistosoma mansoni]|uniref:putative myosin regulatory light chain 2 smooth muscle n=1 Tax=Schistosoma mansoni TaxID=6183 RepID=UPI00022DC403|nr:putative myosin regulatory light chain 2 smooth muscle [Schistosoma mansoni]|eukprot:XP_018650594.1 putative myosin regulatory light chain 2 smooth muscle [Schistosoma mansoni]